MAKPFKSIPGPGKWPFKFIYEYILTKKYEPHRLENNGVIKYGEYGPGEIFFEVVHLTK